MSDDTYTLTAAGFLLSADGTKSVPLDPDNADYRRYLERAGKAHGDVVAEAATLAAARDTADRRVEADRRKAARSGRAKLLALGLTRAEFRALFSDPDPAE